MVTFENFLASMGFACLSCLLIFLTHLRLSPAIPSLLWKTQRTCLRSGLSFSYRAMFLGYRGTGHIKLRNQTIFDKLIGDVGLREVHRDPTRKSIALTGFFQFVGELHQPQHAIRTTIQRRSYPVGAGASLCGPAGRLIHKVRRCFALPKIIPRPTARD